MVRPWTLAIGLVATAIVAACPPAPADEPDPATYWRVQDLRPGMKGTGRTVMVGTKLEEFGAEVLGVMRDVSPGRDMILCRLTGCNLEHAGIIQGMSGSPIYIDGKLVGAVAYAWEFAKDPIAGVTPFEQMVQYARSTDKRLAAEAAGDAVRASAMPGMSGLFLDDPAAPAPAVAAPPSAAAGGMRPIATPLAARGFGPRALAMLGDQVAPLGMAVAPGGGALDEILLREGDRPLEPGSPLSIAMVTGDFDLSGIGTVTHVEKGRVWGFGHPMMGLGACSLPMMTGYIHTVYPRASVSMKMGSPLKVVGVLDTDVSTGVSGRLGPGPDMMPVTVRVRVGRYSEPAEYRVQIVREPTMLSGLLLTVLTGAVDTEGDLPEELTAHVWTRIELAGRPAIELADTYSGPRYSGSMGPGALFGPTANVVGLLTRNPLASVRIESVSCEVEIEPGRRLAEVVGARLASDRLEPGSTLRAFVTLKPYKGPRETVEVALALPDDLPEGTYEAALCDFGNSLRRRLRNEPNLAEPRDVDGVIASIHAQAAGKRDRLYLHVARPDRGLAVRGQALPSLPGSVRAVFDSPRRTQEPALRRDLVAEADAGWVVEGAQSLKFAVVRDAELALSE